MTTKATTIITAGILLANALAWWLGAKYGTLVSAASIGMIGILVEDPDTNDRRD